MFDSISTTIFFSLNYIVIIFIDVYKTNDTRMLPFQLLSAVPGLQGMKSWPWFEVNNLEKHSATSTTAVL